jgi:endonuclease YncB( thermonuclease family)
MSALGRKQSLRNSIITAITQILSWGGKENTLRRYIYITVILAVAIGGAMVAFLPETETTETHQGATGTSHTTVGTASIHGIARVTDGDTIKINDIRIRFHGIDAPESAQTCLHADGNLWNCGKTATRYLKNIILDKPISCEQKDVDRYGRIVAVCSIDGNDLNASMVDSGMALAYRTYSKDYVDNEASAKRSGLGMWGGKFIEPWKWRTFTRLTTQVNVGECNIKGNISSKGVKIYHVPGAPYYANTIISENKGERWFCSEQEAKQAGWRKSRAM